MSTHVVARTRTMAEMNARRQGPGYRVALIVTLGVAAVVLIGFLTCFSGPRQPTTAPGPAVMAVAAHSAMDTVSSDRVTPRLSALAVSCGDRADGQRRDTCNHTAVPTPLAQNPAGPADVAVVTTAVMPVAVFAGGVIRTAHVHFERSLSLEELSVQQV